jgi:hypothetical protein
MSCSTFYWEPVDWLKRNHALIEALNDLTEEFPCLGFWKYVDLLSARDIRETTSEFIACTANLTSTRHVGQSAGCLSVI